MSAKPTQSEYYPIGQKWSQKWTADRWKIHLAGGMARLVESALKIYTI